MAREHQAVIFGENGAGDKIMPFDHTYWYKDLYATPFTGLAETGMSWDESRSFGHWQEYGKLNYFLENYFLNEVDLEQDLWLPGYAEMENENEHYAESIFMQYFEPNHHRFVGVLFNRSWNFANVNEGFGKCIDLGYMQNTQYNFLENQTPLDVAYGPNNEMRIKLDCFSLADLGDEYRFEYFDPDNLDYEGICNAGTAVGPVHCETAHVSIDGLDIKQFPTLAFANKPILLFRAFRNNGEDVFSTKSVSQSSVSSSHAENSRVENETDIQETYESLGSVLIYPNPAYEMLIIKTLSKGPYQIFNEQGKLMKQGQLSAGLNSIEIKEFAAGFYLISACGELQKFVIVE